jgi:prepilin-type N-terminal cleavage/methylation domain-containing protein
VSYNKSGCWIQDSGYKSLSCVVNRVSLVNYAGFTLIELLITMVIFILVIAAGSQIFTGLLTQFKQQSKIAETNIEGIVGLEILRRDIEHAGYGLPWNMPSDTTYTEANSTIICGSANPSNYNDAAPNAPRATVSGNNNCTSNSDYLVIKAVTVATNDPSSKWTELVYCSTCSTTCPSPYSFFSANVCYRDWSSSAENLTSSDLVAVIYPGATPLTERLLKANSGAFSATSFGSIDSSWLPTSASDNIRIVYGLRGSGNAPERPFNRADYYISTSNVPRRCAPNTGVLEKATMDYNGGFNQWPLLDCVADMQAIYRRDTNGDGTIDNVTDDISALTAQQIRDQVKEMRVYILAHEGQYDRNYTYSNSTITIPTAPDPGAGLGSTFDFNARGITNWQNYRWKLYTLVVKPNNLR